MNPKFLIVSQNIGEWYTDLTMSYIRAFKNHNIEFTTYDLSFERPNRILAVLQKQSRLTGILLKKLNYRFIEFVKKSDVNVIFVLKGSNLLPQTLYQIKESFPNKILICFNPDDPFNRGSGGLNIEKSIPLYDQYFIWSNSLVERIKKYGCKNVYYLPFAADTKIIYPYNSDKKVIDVSFIGNSDKERNTFFMNLEREIIGQNLSEFSINIYGNGWNNFKKIKLNNEIEGDKLLKTFSSTIINLNILRKANKNSINMRTFEIPASGAFMLHEKSYEAAEYFKPGIEADYYSDVRDCLDKIKYYLEHEDIRDKIAKAGYDKIIKYNYSYGANVVKILNEVS